MELTVTATGGTSLAVVQEFAGHGRITLLDAYNKDTAAVTALIERSRA